MATSVFTSTNCLFSTVLRFCKVAVGSRNCAFRRHRFYFKPCFTRLFATENGPATPTEIQSDVEKILEKADDYESVKSKVYRIPEDGHKIFLIQPYVRWGEDKIGRSRTELLLEETTTLIQTLPKWHVVDKITVSTQVQKTKFVFGTGNVEKIKEMIKNKKEITAIVFSVSMLTAVQQTSIEKELGFPVYDRYTIVLKIFYDHASSPEAKLQIAIAELGYIRSRLHWIQKEPGKGNQGGASRGRGPGESYLEIQKRLLQEREVKLNRLLEKVKKNRETMRVHRQKRRIPVVAVVGYTNAGKTSLIKALTMDERLEPKDFLFATLDVSPYAGILPSNTKCVYMDTVGFISDIPTYLIASFRVTLEDVNQADLLVHVWDISHPDSAHQREKVLETLKELKTPQHLLDNMIYVANKLDLVPGFPGDADPPIETAIKVSCKTGTGVLALQQEIELRVVKETGRTIKTYRVPMGGPHLGWLYREAGVMSAPADEENSGYLLVQVMIDGPAVGKFKKAFGDLEVK